MKMGQILLQTGEGIFSDKISVKGFLPGYIKNSQDSILNNPIRTQVKSRKDVMIREFYT